MTRISVVIPALNEAGRIAACIRNARDTGADEVIVVDGGSADDTFAEAEHAGADHLLSSLPGRALQLNAGAAAAGGDLLLFLHADTRLPPGACATLRIAMRDTRMVGGAFHVALEVSGSARTWTRTLLGLTGRMIGVRSKLFRRYTGDQAIFVRRVLFERLGGYEPIPLMEDVRFSTGMRRSGRTALLGERVITSARRWEAHGPLRTILLMWFLRAAHALGMSPERCAAIYRDKRVALVGRGLPG